MTEGPINTTTPRKRRWVMPLLFVSLAVNLLVAGIVVGALAQFGGKEGPPDGPARSLLGAPFVGALESSDRRALGQEIFRNRDKLKENRDVLRSRVDALLEELRKETFDRERVLELLAEQRQTAVSRQEFGEALLVDRLGDMTVEQRRGYADRLAKSFRRFSRN